MDASYLEKAAPSTPAPAVPMALDELEGKAEKLLSLVSVLECRLDVVRPQAPTDTPGGAVPRAVPPGSSPLACRLHAIDESLSSCLWRVDALLRTMEV